MNELYIPAPTMNAAALTVHTPRMRIIVHIDERLGGPLLVGHPADGEDHARGEQAECANVAPPPGRAFADRQQHAHQPGREQRGARSS